MKHDMLIIRTVALTVLLAIANPSVVSAQGSKPNEQPKSKWSFLVEPYLMIPNMSGNVGLGDLPDVSIDASSGDIFSKLKMGAMLNLEASNDKWTIATDFIYMDLKQDVKTGTVINSGDVTAKQFAWEIAGLKRLTPWLELGLGGILNSVNSGVNINLNAIGGGTNNKAKELTQTWFDPMLVARVKNKPGQKFIYQLRGEIGGFGIGSDLAWQIQAYAGYRFSKLFQVTGGYRVISLDYTTGSGESRFMYNIDTFGPVVRFGFNF
jgi:hypothetical protein